MRNFVLTAALALSLSAATAAPMVGSTVNYQYYYPDLSSTYLDADNGNKLVGAGVEVSNIVASVGTMDITATQIIIDFSATAFFVPGAFNGWVLTDVLASIDDFTAVTIDAATNMAGFDASNVSFTADTISVNWQGLNFNSDTFVVLNFAQGSVVPEPTSLALVSLALLGVGAASRARRRD